MPRKYIFAINTIVSMAIGVAIGFALTSHLDMSVGAFPQRPPHELSHLDKKSHQKHLERKVRHLSKRLGLSEEQRASLKKVFEETSGELSALRERTRPQFKGIKDKTKTKILELLTPEQKVQFEKMEKRRRQRKYKGGGRRSAFGGRHAPGGVMPH